MLGHKLLLVRKWTCYRWPTAGLANGHGLTETNGTITVLIGHDYLDKVGERRCVSPIADMKVVDRRRTRKWPVASPAAMLAWPCSPEA